jgi:F0F1-type ATP synthase epsilon subunit
MMKIRIITPESLLYEGKTDSLIFPAYEGYMGIQTGHEPLVSIIGKGYIKAQRSGKTIKSFIIDGGFLRINNSDEITIISDNVKETESAQE